MTCPLCMYYWGGVHCNAYPRGERRIPAGILEGRVPCDGTARYTRGFRFHAKTAPPTGKARKRWKQEWGEKPKEE